MKQIDDPNVASVERVAARLGPLRDRVVFLGGAATGLLITDSGAPPIRITKDVDVIIQIAGRLEYRALEKELRALGFRPDPSEGAPLCRWVVEDTRVDVMPTDPDLLGFSNHWYPEAIPNAMVHRLPSGTEIRLVSAPYFLATKLEAFLGRGGGDYLGSHDLEDVVSVLDGRDGVVEEVATCDLGLQAFLVETLAGFLHHDTFLAALQGNLPPDKASQARFPALLERIQRLCALHRR